MVEHKDVGSIPTKGTIFKQNPTRRWGTMKNIIFSSIGVATRTLVEMVKTFKELRTIDMLYIFLERDMTAREFIVFMQFYPEYHQDNLHKFLSLQPTAKEIKELCVWTGFEYTPILEKAFLNAEPTIDDVGELLARLKNVNKKKLWEKFFVLNPNPKKLEFLMANYPVLQIDKVLDLFLKGNPTLEEVERLINTFWNYCPEKLINRFFELEPTENDIFKLLCSYDWARTSCIIEKIKNKEVDAKFWLHMTNLYNCKGNPAIIAAFFAANPTKEQLDEFWKDASLEKKLLAETILKQLKEK